MSTRALRPRRAFALVPVMAACIAAEAQAQLPSPARDAAEEFLQVIRSGDEERLREFYETRYVPELLAFAPMEQHLRMGALFRGDLEGREVSRVRLLGPTEVSMTLEGVADRLELRLQVEPEPPHRIVSLRVSDAGPEIEAESLDAVGPELERLARRDGFSGVVLVADSAAVRFHEAVGLADRATGRPNRPGTRFDVGSLGKLFTATAVLRLAEEGKLELSDRIGSYLEGFTPRVAEHVTIRDLLRHRSGFGDYLSHPEFEADPKRFREPADFLPLARRQELAFAPGTGRRYSNMGFVLLGAVIEGVTGRGYHEVVYDLVFGPAAMRTAGPSGGAEAARRYHRMDGGFVPFDSIYPDRGTPAGGGFASAVDLHRFVRALLAHELLDEENTALLLNDFEATSDSAGVPGEVAFAGGAAGVNAFLLARPAERRWVVVLANIDTVALAPLARRVLDLSDSR